MVGLRRRGFAAITLALSLSTALPTFAQQVYNADHYVKPEGGYYKPDPANPAGFLRTESLDEAVAAWRADGEFRGSDEKPNWGLGALKAELMYALGYFGAGQAVGVIDTGSHVAHPEFVRPDGTNNVHGLTIEAVRAIDDISGKAADGLNGAGDAVTFDGARSYAYSDHGTHVMGIIVGARNGEVLGVTNQGIAPLANGYAVQGEGLGPAEGPGDTFDSGIYATSLQRLIDPALELVAVNNSWGMRPYGTGTGVNSTAQSIQQFVTAQTKNNVNATIAAANAGVVNVFSAGNHIRSAPPDIQSTPYMTHDAVAEQHFLTVLNGEPGDDGLIGGLDYSSNICQQTKWFCVVSPGSSIMAPTLSFTKPPAGGAVVNPDNIHLDRANRYTYSQYSGTSMAGPAVAASLALLKERFPYLTNGQVADILKGTADRRLNVRPGEVDGVLGLGIVDLAAAARGPRDLLGVVDVTLNGNDVWSNDINSSLLIQRQREEAAEVAAWPEREAFLTDLLAGTEEEARARVVAHYREKYTAEIDQAISTIEEGGTPYMHKYVAFNEFDVIENIYSDETALDLYAAQARLLGSEGLTRYWPGQWTAAAKTAYINGMLADKTVDAKLAGEDVGLWSDWLADGNSANKTDELRAELAFMPGRIAHLQGKTYEDGIVKRGTGRLTLSGANTFLGETVVRGGEILLTGSTVSPSYARQDGHLKVGETGVAGRVTARGGLVTVNGRAAIAVARDGGVLTGAGTVTQLSVRNGGFVAPGNGIGTLTVTGDAEFLEGSTYLVEINGRASDKIVVGGTAALDGTVRVSREGVLEALTEADVVGLDGVTYEILTAGAISGNFAQVIPGQLFVGGQVTTTKTAATLKIGRNETKFDDVAETQNGKSAAKAVDQLTFGNPVHDAFVLSDDTAAVSKGFDSLAGNIYPSTRSALIHSGLSLTGAINTRLLAAGGSADSTLDTAALGYASAPVVPSVIAEPERSVWTSVTGQWSKFNSDGNADVVSQSSGNLLFGADTQLADWRVGAVVGYGQNSLSSDHAWEKANSYHVGIYGGTEWDAVAFRTGVAYSWNDITGTRSVTAPGIAEVLNAKYSAGTLQAFGELAYGFEFDTLNFEPYVNLAHVNVHSSAFSETGGSTALSVSSGDTGVTFVTLGARAEHEFALNDQTGRIYGALGWRHAFSDAPKNMHSIAGSAGFSVWGLPVAKDTAMVEAGLSLDLTPTANIGLSYDGQFASGYSDHAVKAALAVKF